MIIGLSGYAQSGKSTVARFLVEDHGFAEVPWAAALKAMLWALNPLIPAGNCDACPPQAYYCDVVNQHVRRGCTVEAAKEEVKLQHPEVRRLLQRLGTEAGRNILGENIWTDTAMRQWSRHDHVVVPDCRFSNELDAVLTYHGRPGPGYLVRVERPGVVAANAHPSETLLHRTDRRFVMELFNGGDLPRLREDVAGMVASLAKLRNSMSG